MTAPVLPDPPGAPPDTLAPTLCVFGTASDVGKSWMTTGIARIFHRAGVDVAPYKAQNMSNNAGVTPEGGELGRAQIVQAEACRLVPHVDMNPLLLKPNTDTGAQVVVLGEAAGHVEARAWFSGAMEARRGVVLAALDRLRARHEFVVCEGAGSCAEVNLRDRDLVNFPVAHHADAPVLLVADIHKGGVFAQVIGTLEVLPAEDRARVQGVIINRFRGDPTLFEDGRSWLQRRAGLPILGVIPWLWGVRIDSEDGLQADVRVDPPPPTDPERVRVAVLRLPHIANFTDVDALARFGADVQYLARPRDLAPYDLLILPGTRNTRGDLAWLRAQGWDRAIARHVAAGGRVLGICGGFQMLGEAIEDPEGIEGPSGGSPGLGLLPVRTVLVRGKRTRAVRGALVAGGAAVQGYEIHNGETERLDPAGGPMIVLDDGRPDGLWSEDGRIAGTYLHGLLDEPEGARELLVWCHPGGTIEGPTESAAVFRQRSYDRLAEHLEAHLDLPRLFDLAGVPAG